jgi:tetratricopeptide (TPR) repeat protein
MSQRGKVAVAVVVGLTVLGLVRFLTSQTLRQSERSAIRDALAERDLPRARDLIDEFLRDRDDDAEMHFLAAQTARRLDDFPSADRHLDRYRHLNGNPDEAALERILQRAQSGDLRGADGVIKICFEQPEHPAATPIIEALVRGYLAAGRQDIAIVVAEVWLKRNPAPADRAYANYLRGNGLALQSRFPEALGHYREALALNPRLHEAAFALAEVLASESPTEALPLYDRLREEGYRPTEVALGTARCRRQLGEPDRAAALVAPLVAEQPVNVAVLVEAAKIDLDRNNPAEAERHLKAAIGIAPKHRDANVQLARCLRDLGRDAEARVQLEVVRKIDEELDRKAP